MKIVRLALALGALLTLGAAPAQDRLTVAQLRAKYMTGADRIIDVGGVELRYRDEGKGPVVLLLHGSNSSLETYDGVVAALRGRYRLIRFDQPPTGLSGSISEAAKIAVPTPEAMMIGFLDRLKIRSVIAVGVSSGGTMAYYLAGSHPERVSALILCNTPSDPVDTSGVVNPPDLVAAEKEATRTGLRGRDFFSAYLRFLAGDPARVTPAIIDRMSEMNRRAPEANQRFLYALTANNAATLDRLGKVTAPTLLVWGMRDPVLPYRAAVALRDHLTATHASMLLLDDAGHYPPMEVPARFAAIIDAYVRQVAPKPGS